MDRGGEDYDSVDHIFRPISKLRTLNNQDRIVDGYTWLTLEDPSYGLYVSRCVCKGANGEVSKWKRESDGRLEQREKALERDLFDRERIRLPTMARG
jgi:hypothetical protein